jgi:uncharacterized protein (TIGR03435 family)
MLQNLLADRFRLVLRRELREMPVYTLTVATPGKMKLSPNETTQPPNFPLPPGFPPTPPVGRGQKFVLIRVQGGVNMFGHAIPMSELTKDLRQHAGRVVVDKTGFTGVFDYNLEFAAQAGPAAPSAIPTPPPSPEAVPPLPGVPSVPTAPQAPLPSLSDALAEQLGLKLEAARLPIEVLIIESVERPAQN